MDRIVANKQMIYCLTVITLIIAVAIGVLTARWLVRPVLALNRAAKAIAAGQWDYYPPSVQRKDELGELALSFHQMADQLRQFVTDLEQKVADRTRKLESSNEELRLAKKSAEIAYDTLQEREERYRNFVSSSLVSNFLWEFKKPMPLSLSFEETCNWFREHMILAECNDLLAKSYGYGKAEDIIGWTFYDIILKDDQMHDEIVRNYMELNYTANKLETQETDKQGNTIWFLNIAQPTIKDNHLYAIYGTTLDISDRKKAEQELQEHRCHLEELVKERTSELEIRTEELEIFNKAMVDREMRIIEIKEKMNRLCKELGREPEYPPVWNDE